jgi:uncharacterized Zn finger protein
MNALEPYLPKAIEPLRCPACGGDHTLSTWVCNDKVESDRLQVRRRCVECGQVYVATYQCIRIEANPGA